MSELYIIFILLFLYFLLFIYILFLIKNIFVLLIGLLLFGIVLFLINKKYRTLIKKNGEIKEGILTSVNNEKFIKCINVVIDQKKYKYYYIKDRKISKLIEKANYIVENGNIKIKDMNVSVYLYDNKIIPNI